MNKRKLNSVLLAMFCTTIFFSEQSCEIRPTIEEIVELEAQILTSTSLDSIELLSLFYEKLELLDRLHLSFEERAKLTEYQSKLLRMWEPAPELVQTVVTTSDKDIRRRSCRAFDSAPANTPRAPRFRRLAPDLLRQQSYEIPVAFHVIADDTGEGLLPNMHSLLFSQIDTLNNAFKVANIIFKLESVDTTFNNEWFDAGYFGRNDTSAAVAMTDMLNINPDSVLNVYTIRGGNRFLGEASFPWWDTKGTNEDVVIIYYQATTGGSFTMYSEGNTLVHEVGHYLGLYHTFHMAAKYQVVNGSEVKLPIDPNACADSTYWYGCTDKAYNTQPFPNFRIVAGDQVDDTPAMRLCNFKDCTSTDTCSDLPGGDPIHNYMGYRPDACLVEFTPGQILRIRRYIFEFRRTFIKQSA